MKSLVKRIDTNFEYSEFEKNGARYRCLDYLIFGDRIAGKLALDNKQVLAGQFSVKKVSNRWKYIDELIFTIRAPQLSRNQSLTVEDRNNSRFDYVEIYFPFIHAERMLEYIFRHLVYAPSLIEATK